MIKYIYKITNKTNNKVYIGQSKTPKTRFSSHIKRKSGCRTLQNDIKKLGLSNFSFEIIEFSKYYNERERFWIKHYSEIGEVYNKHKGGEEPPVKYGSENCFTKYSKDKIDNIKLLLKESTYSSREIADIHSVAESTVNRINIGLMWFDENEKYPLRPRTILVDEDKYALIVSLLKDTQLSHTNIANIAQVSRTTVTSINRGQNHRRDDVDYPIRKGNKRYKTKPVSTIS